MDFKPKNIGTDRAFLKIKHYCAYAERSHAEVKKKLYSFGLYQAEVEELLSRLIEENYLNEERYAMAFAGGHFRMKDWGKTKIRYELKQNGVSEYCIKKALAAIPEADYRKTIQKLFDIKWKSLSGEQNIFTKKKKLQNFLIGKGFEFDLITDLLKGV